MNIDFDESFKRNISKIKDASIKSRVEKLILKIRENPEIGKPMKHNRKARENFIYLPLDFFMLIVKP